MQNVSGRIYCAILALLLPCFATAKLAPTLDKTYCPTIETKSIERLNIRASLFLNATRSSLPGGRYLLNEQLSNIKFNADLRLNDWNRFHAVLIYNTAPTRLNPGLFFDEAFLQTKNSSQSPWFFESGKKWLTFGNYKNDLIYKPFTKALGQTNEYAIVAGYEKNAYANISVFNPYVHVRNASAPFSYNFNAGIKQEAAPFSYNAGLSYLASMTDTQLFLFNKGFGGLLHHHIDNTVPGAAAYLNLQYKNWTAYASYVTALHSFNKNLISFQQVGAQPAAFSIQSGYEFSLHNTRLKFIGFYDHSFQALALLLTKRRVGAELNIYPTTYTDVQLQFSRDFNYTPGESAQGLNKTVTGSSIKTDTLALQVILYFK